jgi:GAF domain-containing protein
MDGDTWREKLTPHSALNLHSAIDEQEYSWLIPIQEFNRKYPTQPTPSADEASRLKELYQYQVLDAPPDPKLDELTLLAADICQAPIALISFVDSDRQWFKSKVGLTISETPRYVAFCAHTIQQSDVLIVSDALADPRFSNNPLVTGSPYIRFYAGAPLVSPNGFALGTLCVIDYVPRELNQQQIRTLQTLSHQVIAQLELDREKTEFQQVTKKLYHLQQQFAERELVSQQESILFNLANQIRHSLDLDTILQTSVDEIRSLLQVDR